MVFSNPNCVPGINFMKKLMSPKLLTKKAIRERVLYCNTRTKEECGAGLLKMCMSTPTSETITNTRNMNSTISGIDNKITTDYIPSTKKEMYPYVKTLNRNVDKLIQTMPTVNTESTTLPKLYHTVQNPNLDTLNIRKRMLYISKEKNKYKQKIIYTQIAILILLILFITGLYNMTKK